MCARFFPALGSNYVSCHVTCESAMDANTVRQTAPPTAGRTAGVARQWQHQQWQHQHAAASACHRCFGLPPLLQPVAAAVVLGTTPLTAAGLHLARTVNLKAGSLLYVGRGRVNTRFIIWPFPVCCSPDTARCIDLGHCCGELVLVNSIKYHSCRFVQPCPISLSTRLATVAVLLLRSPVHAGPAG